MRNVKSVNTVVLPIAGLGSRFLPVTKSVPKELLPILNRPLIEYAVAEAKQSGIEKFILVLILFSSKFLCSRNSQRYSYKATSKM